MSGLPPEPSDLNGIRYLSSAEAAEAWADFFDASANDCSAKGRADGRNWTVTVSAADAARLAVVLRQLAIDASGIDARQRPDPAEGLDPKGESPVANGETPNA